MPQHHPRPSEAHHPPHLIAHAWLVAVNGTLGAHWLARTELTSIDTQQSVVEQLGTGAAKRVARPVMVPTVHANHNGDGSLFV